MSGIDLRQSVSPAVLQAFAARLRTQESPTTPGGGKRRKLLGKIVIEQVADSSPPAPVSPEEDRTDGDSVRSMETFKTVATTGGK